MLGVGNPRGERIDWVVTFTAAIYNMVRMRPSLVGA
jgi:hypothetical protein